MSNTIFWVNGKPEALVSAADRSVHYGDGVFETIRVRDHQPEFLARHLARLRVGCERLGFNAVPWDRVETETLELARQKAEGALKIILSRGSGGRGYRFGSEQHTTRIIGLYDLPQWPDSITTTGIRARVCSLRLSIQPRLAGIKHLNRLEQVLARAEWDDESIREGLMLDLNDRLIEGTMSNVFLVREGRLLTPDLSQCGVSGIMRSVIMDVAERADITVETCALTLDDVRTADEVFICNSLIGIWPVTTIDTIGVYPVGPISRKLGEQLQQVEASRNSHWYAS